MGGRAADHAVVGFCYFLIWELTEEHPVVDLRLFARRNFLVGVAAMSVGFMMFFGISIMMPLWLQTQMGYTAIWSGLAVAPVSLLPLLLSRSISRWLQRSDPRLFASGAFLALAAASFMRAGFTTQVDFTTRHGGTHRRPRARVLDCRAHAVESDDLLGAIDFFWLTGCLLVALMIVIWFARPPFGATGTAPVE